MGIKEGQKEMGLDQYLYKKTYVKNWEWTKPENIHEVSVIKGGVVNTSIKPERIVYIVEEVAYWRKSNQIHKWFVDNVQGGIDDCKNYYVSREDLQALLNLINECLINRNRAQELLPTRAGFFFGSLEYDEYYWEDLERTKEMLTPLINDESGEYEYHSSW